MSYYVVKRDFYRRAHEKALFTVEIYPDIIVEFGEPKSKLNSKKYKLTQISFSKERYSQEDIKDFCQRFQVKYLEKGHSGKKLPPVYKVIGRPDRLIHGGYIVICENTSFTRESYKKQVTYDFWFNEFYKNSILSNDSTIINNAIPLLLDRINNDKEFLNQIPNKDSRILEEIVAEIFTEYGYEVELTKKTRDGGKDVIALKKVNGTVEKKLLIECKHWKDKVDVSPVRELMGVAVAEDVTPTGVILATTSRFTEDAKALEFKAVTIELERKDFDDIIDWIGEYGAIQFSKVGINRCFNALRLGL